MSGYEIASIICASTCALFVVLCVFFLFLLGIHAQKEEERAKKKRTDGFN